MNVALYYHNSFNTAVEKKEKKKEKRDERALIDYAYCPEKQLLTTFHTSRQLIVLLPYRLYSS